MTRVYVPWQAKPKWHFLEADEIEYSRDYISKNSRMFYLQRLQVQMMQQRKMQEEQMQRDELARQAREKERASTPPRPWSPAWFIAMAKQSVVANIWRSVGTTVNARIGAMMTVLVGALSQISLYNRFIGFVTAEGAPSPAGDTADMH